MKKTLFIIAVVALTLLGAAFGLDTVAQANAQRDHVRLMETLLPGGSDFQRVAYTDEDGVIRSVHQCDGGFVIETVTRGYADEIVMLVGVNNEGKVTGLVTLEAYETLGLGSYILNDHRFLSQFLNKTGSFAVGEDGIDAISGATVSSKAVARCVTAAVSYVTGADVDSSATQWGG